MLGRWAPAFEQIVLNPSSGGRFEITLDGELLFSKLALGRHAEPGEVIDIIAHRLGPALLEQPTE